jgi:hypothetical protein
MSQPKWVSGERFERVAHFTLKAPPKSVFPLLCPVREYEWLPDWKCTMYYSKSGVAEKDAIFSTVEAPGRKAMWTAITYEPDLFIEYLIVSGADAVVRLGISLEDGGASTSVTWRLLLTGTSRLGKKALSKAWSAPKFDGFIGKMKARLAHYLETGAMLGE